MHPLWYICITVRLFMAFMLPKVAILIIGLGFGYKALTGSNNETQINKVFWHETRIIHSFLFLLAYFTTSNKIATKILLFDVLFSIMYRVYYETI